ncbi:MAG: type I-B CRISPR-associated endonuclease Cas1b [Atribacterota bacterium]
MSESIYIFSHGTLKRKQNTLFFETQDGTQRYLPIEGVRDLHLFGEVTLNKEVLEFLSRQSVLLYFYNHYGYYVGGFYPREHYNSGCLVLKQAEHYLKEEKRVFIARQFVRGAIQNAQKVLEYYSRRNSAVDDAIVQMESLLRNVADQKTVEELMALEGNMREVYYQSFDAILENQDFQMEKRTKRPPRNRLNALISFGNSLLYTAILSEIYQTHLDPRIGFLHATNFRRFSLNLDVAEIFKPIIVERVIFALINKHTLSAKDFSEYLGGLYLGEKGRKIFIEKFEEKMKSTVCYKKIGREVSYRRLIRLELYKLEKHLLGEEEYEPLVSEW